MGCAATLVEIDPGGAFASGDYAPLAPREARPAADEILAAWEAVSPDDIGLSPTGELEPAICEAFYLGVEALWSSAEKVQAFYLRLVRQGDPKGLMDGDGSTDEGPETNAPTPERVASRGDFDGGRKDAPWRHLPIVEAMVRRGQIAPDDAQATRDAAERFYRDFILGNKGASVTSRYGEAAGAGTPLAQQNVRYYTDKNGVEREEMSPEERRANASGNWMAACHAIGVHRCPVTGAPRPGTLLTWMLRLICEDYSYLSEKTPTLEDAGRAYVGCKSKQQAMSAGVAMIKFGLERLVSHYDAVDR